MSGNPGRDFAGELHHAYVGGAGGFRLIYWILKNPPAILPTYFSPLAKNRGFQYSKTRWRETSWEIYGRYLTDFLEFGTEFESYRNCSIWRGEL